MSLHVRVTVYYDERIDKDNFNRNVRIVAVDSLTRTASEVVRRSFNRVLNPEDRLLRAVPAATAIYTVRPEKGRAGVDLDLAVVSTADEAGRLAWQQSDLVLGWARWLRELMETEEGLRGRFPKVRVSLHVQQWVSLSFMVHSEAVFDTVGFDPAPARLDE